MLNKTTTLFGAMLGAALLIPASAIASPNSLLEATKGSMTCGAGKGADVSFRNPNSKNLKITRIQLTNRNGKVIKTWKAGTNMPTGMPKSGTIPARGAKFVEGTAMFAGVADADNKGPRQMFINWKIANGTIGYQPRISGKVEYFGDTDTTPTGGRTFGCVNM